MKINDPDIELVLMISGFRGSVSSDNDTSLFVALRLN